MFLYSQPKVAVKDFRVISTLDDSYTDGIFKLAVDVRNHALAGKKMQVFYELIDKVSGKGTWESNPFVFAYEFVLVD